MIFDAHADILTDIYQEVQKGHKQSFLHRHIERYIAGGITHSIFVNWTNPKTTNPNQFQEIFDVAIPEIEAMSETFFICKTYQDMFEARIQNKIGVILGMEGVAQLQDIAMLHTLYDKGVRHASLTWNEVNKYAGGLSSQSEGLTLLGKELLTEMEKLGMIIDLAHANPITFNDIIEHTKGPLIISHGNTKALCNHIRNYTDEQLLQLRDRGGVIGICGIPSFIAEKAENQTVEQMAKHIDYAVKLMGIDHVGVGFDVCYYLDDIDKNNAVSGFLTIADAPNLFAELRQIGYNEIEIEQIAFGNFARIVKQILK
jgi:membrane dipeptidase